MKVKNVSLEWYVLRWDFNTKKVINYNILQWRKEDIANEVRRKSIHNKSILREYLKTVFMIIGAKQNVNFLFLICTETIMKRLIYGDKLNRIWTL